MMFQKEIRQKILELLTNPMMGGLDFKILPDTQELTSLETGLDSLDLGITGDITIEELAREIMDYLLSELELFGEISIPVTPTGRPGNERLIVTVSGLKRISEDEKTSELFPAKLIKKDGKFVIEVL